VLLETPAFNTLDFQQPHGLAALRALLRVATGWYYFGRDNQAEPVLEASRSVVAGDQAPREQTQLACVYAIATSQALVGDGVARGVGATVSAGSDSKGRQTTRVV